MKEPTHKFQEKIEETYEQLFRLRYGDVVQVAREFQRVLGEEKTNQILGEMSDRMGVLTVKQMTEKEPIRTFDDFVTSYKNTLKDPLFSHALTATVKEETPQKLTLHITECLWAKTFTELNAADLGYIMVCSPDFPMAQAFHPKIKMSRTKTLMQGNDCCDHTYTWEE